MKRITLVSGLIGSGKSTFAINYALERSKTEKNIKFLDLDYLNVYFRSRTVKELFAKNNIEMIGSSLEYSHQADLPAISGAIYTPFNDKSMTAIFDLGGDLNGLFVVKSFRDKLKKEEVDLFLVINKFRISDDELKTTLKFIKDCEDNIGFKVTGLISNGHMMQFTTDEIVKENLDFTIEISKATNIPILYYVKHDKELDTDIPNMNLVFKPKNS